MNERIKELRKALGLTQQQMADKLGIKRGTVATFEVSRVSVPSDAAVMLICKTFNVREEWLRTGEGEMFEPVEEREALERELQELFHGQPEPFKTRLITSLLHLDLESWRALEEFIAGLVEAHQERDKRAALAEIMAKDPADMTDEEYEVYSREYRRQVLEEKRAAEASSALRDTGAAG